MTGAVNIDSCLSDRCSILYVHDRCRFTTVQVKVSLKKLLNALGCSSQQFLLSTAVCNNKYIVNIMHIGTCLVM